MPGYIPALNSESLSALRRLVQTMHSGNGQSVPLKQLVQLAEQVKTENGITIDFQATESLGSPMVVVQVPSTPQLSTLALDLSKREQDVAGLIAEGLSNKEIAKRLHISVGTVKDHIHRILTKTQLPNRTAIAMASRTNNVS
ncbi:MAG: LuxR C-terminal-related transcriptional regulator [Gemmatales bacterium]